jgi:hypothetical protein
MTFHSAIRPYSQAERDADEAKRRPAQERAAARRRACPAKERYEQPGTPQTRKRDLRRVGERED